MATPLLWTRQPDTMGVLGLALSACDGSNGSGSSGESFERIRELIEAARAVWATVPEIADPDRQRTTTRLAFRLLHLADIEAVTSDA
jgi:hypothetical protein